MSDCDSFLTDRECRHCYGTGRRFDKDGDQMAEPCHNCYGLGLQPTNLGEEVVSFLKRLGFQPKAQDDL